VTAKVYHQFHYQLSATKQNPENNKKSGLCFPEKNKTSLFFSFSLYKFLILLFSWLANDVKLPPEFS
jgi:hypothetical protein